MNREMPMGMRFAIIHRALKNAVNARLREKDLTGVQMAVMGQLKHLEDSGMEEISQRDLENAARLTHPTMTDIIKRLEKKGLIACSESPTDRRRKCISSTPGAEKLKEELSEMEREICRELFFGLSEEQIRELKSTTDIIIHNAEVYLCQDCRKGSEGQ